MNLNINNWFLFFALSIAVCLIVFIIIRKEKCIKTIKNILNKWTLALAVLFVIIGILFIITFSLISPFNDWRFCLSSNTEIYAHYGSFIGGFVGPLFSLAGFFLLYKTFRLQKESLDEQRKSYNNERFVSPFFSLLNQHREVLYSIKATDLNDKSVNYQSGEALDQSLINLRRVWDVLLFDEYFTYIAPDFTTQYRRSLDFIEDIIEEIQTQLNSFDPEYDINRYEILRLELMKQKKRGLICQLNYKLKINKLDKDDFDSKSNDLEKVRIAFLLFFVRFENSINDYLEFTRQIIRTIYAYDIEVNKNEEIVDFKKYSDLLKVQLGTSGLILFFYYSIIQPELREICTKYHFFDGLNNKTIKHRKLLDEKHSELIRI